MLHTNYRIALLVATNFLSKAESLVIGSDVKGILVLDRNKNLSYKIHGPSLDSSRFDRLFDKHEVERLLEPFSSLSVRKKP